ncbi:MAG: ABC transporter substrate-binding protein [bacterium]|nr:ABC transporter substrate-binding protein [bacterium]
MKHAAMLFAVVAILMCIFAQGFAQKIETIQARPLVDVVTDQLRSVSDQDAIPVITWGGDVATQYALEKGLISGRLFLENNFVKQVRMCVQGKTPYIRGTAGMVNAAAEALEAKGITLVPIYKLTWSTGGDVLVVRNTIKKLSDLRGKKIALQLYGPHMDLIANILLNAKVSPNEVTFVWFEELTLPGAGYQGPIRNPVEAFQHDQTIDAVLCIDIDAASLTASEGGVPGARKAFSTATASRIISDWYAVRSDYLEANRTTVEKFVGGLMKGQEGFSDLQKNWKSQKDEWNSILQKSANLLLGSANLGSDVAGMLQGCTFVDYNGNMQFFTGKGGTRNMETLTKEIQSSFVKMGIMRSRVNLTDANWNYAALAAGLRYAKSVPAEPTEAYNPKKVEAFVAKRIEGESGSFAESAMLPSFEILFKPNQTEFSTDEYSDNFREAQGAIDAFGGAIVVVEGHSDPTKVAKMRVANDPTVALVEQAAKNTSLERANEVRKSFIAFCKKRGTPIDASKVTVAGVGVKHPKYPKPATEEQWKQNFRVVFRMVSLEGESTSFEK